MMTIIKMIKKADKFLLQADYVFSETPLLTTNIEPLTVNTAFASELYLKAIYVYYGMPYERTHNLKELYGSIVSHIDEVHFLSLFTEEVIKQMAWAFKTTPKKLTFEEAERFVVTINDKLKAFDPNEMSYYQYFMRYYCAKLDLEEVFSKHALLFVDGRYNFENDDEQLFSVDGKIFPFAFALKRYVVWLTSTRI